MVEGDGRQIEWLDDLVQYVQDIHDRIITESGGVHGEHTALLYSTCARPFQTAFGELIHRTKAEQAAALFHGIISDHCFVDGNKQTATL
jgi:prophage maintenance system killer protein